MKRFGISNHHVFSLSFFVTFAFHVYAFAGDNGEQFFQASTNLACNMDMRLFALATNPALLEKIDQREQFLDQSTFRAVRDRSFDAAAFVLPGIFSRQNGRDMFAHVAVCPDDSRIFFYDHRNGFDVLGWCPIQRSDICDVNAGLAILIVPRQDQDSALVRVWKTQRFAQLSVFAGTNQFANRMLSATNIQDSAMWFQWVHGVAKEALGAELVAPTTMIKTGDVLRTTASLQSRNGKHGTVILQSDAALCAHIRVVSDEQPNSCLKLSPEKPWLKETGGVPPFWPPK